MGRLDVYYRAFTEYRKRTQDNSECGRQRKYIARAGITDDRIEVVKTDCVIEDDWIDAIEKGMDFIDKCIKEERQFILSQGEVVPIEKVKNVSKESVEHLAKNSNLLTRKPDPGHDIIPDKVYTVERLTDYAVYENRFLYMLLCYLRDFISLRYNKILELTTTYTGKMSAKKTVDAGKRKVVMEVSLDEKVADDEMMRKHNPCREKLDRIDGLLKGVIAFLGTPLMEEVSNAPMIKPPITETNVLKMNKNFKGAVQLYYFIAAYDKPGYYTHTKSEVISPYPDNVADEMAEGLELYSFLTYQYGMGVTGYLKAEYDRQLKLEKEAEEKRKEEQLKALRKRIKEGGGNVEEYLLALEERNRTLENNHVQFMRAKAEIVTLKATIDQLEADKVQLSGTIADLRKEIEDKINEMEAQRVAYEDRIATMEAEHVATITRINDECSASIASAKAECESAIAAAVEKCDAAVAAAVEKSETEISAAKAQCAQEIADATAKCNEQVSATKAECENKLAEQQARHENERNDYLNRCAAKFEEAKDIVQKAENFKLAAESEARKCRQDAAAAHEEMVLAYAKLNAIKHRYDSFEGSEDYTSRDGFTALEEQYKIFKQFYSEQWRATKKAIRQQYLRPIDRRNASDEGITVGEHGSIEVTQPQSSGNGDTQIEVSESGNGAQSPQEVNTNDNEGN